MPNKHAYPNKHVWWKKIKKINKSVGAQYSLIPNKGIGWNNSIGRQNFQKLIIGEGGTISNKRVGWQTQSLLV